LTVIIESLKFTCNRCGGDMTYEETKLGMKWTNVEKPENIHLCYDCGNETVDFANGKLLKHLTVNDAQTEKYPTMKQLIKDSKKKKFRGNQHGFYDSTGKWVPTKKKLDVKRLSGGGAFK